MRKPGGRYARGLGGEKGPEERRFLVSRSAFSKRGKKLFSVLSAREKVFFGYIY